MCIGHSHTCVYDTVIHAYRTQVRITYCNSRNNYICIFSQSSVIAILINKTVVQKINLHFTCLQATFNESGAKKNCPFIVNI